MERLRNVRISYLGVDNEYLRMVLSITLVRLEAPKWLQPHRTGFKGICPAQDGESEFNKEVHVYVRNHQNWW